MGDPNSRATTPSNAPPSNPTEDSTADSRPADAENGGVSAGEVSGSPSPSEPPREDRAAASARWRREGRDQEVGVFRDRVRDEYMVVNPGCKRRDAHDYAWERARDLFPPEGVQPVTHEYPSAEAVAAPAMQAGQIQGLDSIPTTWPVLQANASQQAELAWVQANRLLMVEERPGGATVVRLERALSPAPSHAALGWLETSIRSYAKYVDVVARSFKGEQDGQELVRRERVAIDEIRRLLDEMYREGGGSVPSPHDK